jgi:putative hemolysin
MKKKSFQRMDIRELLLLPKWLTYLIYPFIWIINRWLLVSNMTNNIIITAEKKGLKNCDFMAYASDYFAFNVHIKGSQNMPQKGAAILVANHPGGGDICAIFKALHILGRTDIKILINPLVYFAPIEDMVIPIYKNNILQKKQMLQAIDKAFMSGSIFPIFPAGQDSRIIDKKIQDTVWKKTFITHAIRYNVPIIPCHISGSNSSFFYAIARMRKFLGIKFNIEQFFLIRELYKAQHSNITVTIGKSICPDALHLSDDPQSTIRVVQKIRDHVYTLASDPNKKFVH